MGIGKLRVFNDDTLVPGAAWPMHPHRDIEGVTYVAEGTFEHADSRGNGGILPPGSVQRATLGSGMEHSERNGSTTEPMRFIQMWILPARRGLEPSIEQRSFSDESRRNVLKPVLVPADGYATEGAPRAEDAVHVHQDAAVYAGLLDAGASVTHRMRDGFLGYFFVVHGAVDLAADGEKVVAIEERGAAKVLSAKELTIATRPGAEVLLVEVGR
jgi:hypothetical protein